MRHLLLKGTQRLAKPTILGSGLLPRRAKRHKSFIFAANGHEPASEQRADTESDLAARQQRLHVAEQEVHFEQGARTERLGNSRRTNENLEQHGRGKAEGVDFQRREHFVQSGDSLCE